MNTPRRLLAAAVQEGDDLAAGAGCIGSELAVAGTGRDATAHRPCDGVGVILVCRHVAEARTACSGRAICAIQERHALAAGAGVVDAEGAVSQTIGDAVFQRPCHCVIARQSSAMFLPIATMQTLWHGQWRTASQTALVMACSGRTIAAPAHKSLLSFSEPIRASKGHQPV